MALTCTRLYHQFSTVLKSEDLRYLEPYSDRHRHEAIRTELLVTLETDSCLFCNACLTLHLRREFFGDVLKIGAPRTCKWPRRIQLYRCLRLTLGKLIQLREQLQSAITTNSMGPHIMNGMPIWYCYQERDDCWFSITLALDESRRVVFRFDFTMSFDRPESHSTQSIFVCRNGWQNLTNHAMITSNQSSTPGRRMVASSSLSTLKESTPFQIGNRTVRGHFCWRSGGQVV